MAEDGDIVRLYRDDDNTKALLIGGPDDGIELQFTGPAKPILLMPSNKCILSDKLPYDAIATDHLVYSLATGRYGLPRRDDIGRVTYRYLGQQ